MIKELVRSNLKNFQPYSSARSLYQEGIFMDANENPFGSVVSGLADNLNWYPDPKSINLRKALGEFIGVEEKNVFVGSGSDEIIDLLIRLFVETDEEIVVLEPTYGMYKVAAEVAGVRVRSLFLAENFELDISALLSQVTTKSKIIFLCSPNNPTGTIFKRSDIETVCKNFKGIVVVDEAYIEFAKEPSLVSKVQELENLVVMRTFSKAWGLAGIRVGYAVGNETTVEYLLKIKLPYNLNRLSGEIAIKALGQYPKMQEFKEQLLKERNRLSHILTQMGFEVFPSDANFILVRYPNASDVAKKLAKEFGIIIRDFSSKPMLEDCVRISIGTPEQNDLLLKALDKII